MSLIAVGDRVAKIAWFDLPHDDEGELDWHTHGITKLSRSMLPQRLCWESSGLASPWLFVP
jgi:hypothetical protein